MNQEQSGFSEQARHATTVIPDDFSLVSGGLIYGFTSWLGGRHQKGLKVTTGLLILITWVFLGLLAYLEQYKGGIVSAVTFFEDFQVHIRYLLIMPFLVLIEAYVDKTFVDFLMTSEKLVPKSRTDQFASLIRRVDRLTNSFLPEILLLVVIYGAVIGSWPNLAVFNDHRQYLLKEVGTLNTAGWYYVAVSSPIFQLFIFRWAWRWLVWAYTIIGFRSLQVRTDPFHADRTAGLSFLNFCPLAFSFVMMGLSGVFASAIAIEVVYMGHNIFDYVYQILVYLIVLNVAIYMPLLFLVPEMLKSKSWAIQYFGQLLKNHDWAYAKKWIEDHNDNQGNELVGSPDHSSLADINGSYAAIDGMKVLIIDTRMMVLSLVVNALVFFPLVFTHYSTVDAF